MKTIIKLQLIAILLSATMIAKGQPFVPVISSDSTSWDIAWKELFGNVMGNLYSVGNNDTLFHDLYFQFFGSNAEYVGKIREDANTGKIWYTPPDSDDEFLIMDLSLTIGDTFELPVFNTTISIEVVDVYHIDQRKYLEFDYPTQWDEPLRFIEGVGRNIAMFNFWFGDFTYVACKYNDGELFYVNSNPHFEGCELNTSSISESFNDGLMVFPNPCNSYLKVKIPYYFGEKPLTMKAYNIFGEIVLEIPVSNSVQGLNTETLAKGLYFIIIQCKEQILFNSKFLKQ